MILSAINKQVTVLSDVAYYRDTDKRIWSTLLVKLTQQQYHMGVAQAKFILSQPSFQRLKHHTLEDHAKAVIQANLAETACAIALGINGSIGDFMDGDLDGGIEVRHTLIPNGGLLVRPNDHLDRPFVFVTGQDRDFIVHGFAIGDDVKKRGNQIGGEKNSAWVLPREELHPIGGLLYAYYHQRRDMMFT